MPIKHGTPDAGYCFELSITAFEFNQIQALTHVNNDIDAQHFPVFHLWKTSLIMTSYLNGQAGKYHVVFFTTMYSGAVLDINHVETMVVVMALALVRIQICHEEWSQQHSAYRSWAMTMQGKFDVS